MEESQRLGEKGVGREKGGGAKPWKASATL